MKQETSKENAFIEDRFEYIYVEHSIIEQDDSSICVIKGREKTPIPVASIAVLLLGPGTSITHRAIEALRDSGCLCVWCGEHMRTYYATGMDEKRSSKNILRQIECYSAQNKHMSVCRKMYGLRFPDMNIGKMSQEQMMGAEGLRMKEVYKEMAEKYAVEWNGRCYDPNNWDDQDEINKALSIAHKLLYNICHAGIVGLGYSPAIGFIHTGTMRSFIYDVADLYKTETSIPAAFEVISKGGYEDLGAEVRKNTLKYIKSVDVLKKIVKDMKYLFDGSEEDIEGEVRLWDKNKTVKAGKNYADTRK